jgi:hypothetical protein
MNDISYTGRHEKDPPPGLGLGLGSGDDEWPTERSGESTK